MDINELLKSLLGFTVFDYLRTLWGPAPWVEVVLDIISILVVSTFALLVVFLLGWTERKVLARMQDRIGPNRVGGRFGQLQMVADVVKMLTKEMIIPQNADKIAYFAAPALSVMTSLLLFAVLPFAPGLIGVDLNVGIFYVLSVSSVSVVALLLAGWGSNNKYALLGAFRAVAQLVSYEVPMILSILVPIILARTMSTMGIVEAQAIPFFFYAPVAALLFFVSALAETGRSPFDLLEAESEIIAGFHTEYTGMNFGLFMAAEYIAILFMCGLFVTAFWSGYRFFGLENAVLNGIAIGNALGFLIIAAKMAIVFFVFMWIRATLPRFRIDQLLNFGWKFMVPLSIVSIFTVIILDKILADLGIIGGANEVVRMAIHLVSNLIIGWAALEWARRRAREARLIYEEEQNVGGDAGHGHDHHADHGHGHHDHGHAVPAHAD
ncbi:MAG: NADH-quinone oxidoreductase subunit NuoH [Chloroflexota bacterium]